MAIGKNVQISTELFIDLYDYICEQEDEKSLDLCRKMTEKIDSLIDREIFTKYKRAATPSERERYRQQYLDRKMISKSFQTDKEIPYGKL